MVKFMTGLQGGFTTFPCYLCYWDSRDAAAHYHRQDWLQRTEFSVESKNEKWESLMDPPEGNQDLKDISPKYVSPLVRKLYWDKEFLEKALSEEEIIYTNGKADKSTELDLDEDVNSSLTA